MSLSRLDLHHLRRIRENDVRTEPDDKAWTAGGMEVVALVWFGIAGGGFVFALSLLHQRYVKKTPHAVQSRGSFAMFATIMVLFAIGAAVAGIASSGG